ncbi:MAG: hypothetical protein LRY27_01765 [Chitinophagales bacterium]|nr:hypothetical protein [Chitinophagales bacterium]
MAMAVSFLVALVGPLLMGFQGWNDHDRSGRTTAVDFASNYLESCEPNAIIFTQGDNDTYPLWYAQEVENIRPDVRVINLSLLGVDWYVNQLRYKMNDAPPVKLTFTPDKLRGGGRDITYYVPRKLDPSKYYNALDVMDFINDDKNAIKKQEQTIYNYPTKKLSFIIDKEKASKIGLLSTSDSTARNLDTILLDVNRSNLMKNDLITLDIVANNINDRPIYFAVSVSPSAYLGFQKYFEQDGLTYRIVPRLNKSGRPDGAPVNTDEMYDNVMTKYKWGQLDSNPKVYVDENISRMTMNLVNNFVRLAEQLITEGKNAKAIEVLDKAQEALPVSKVPYNFFHSAIPGLYYRAGEKEKAFELADKIVASAEKELNYDVKVYNEKIMRVRSHNPALLAQYQQGLFTQNRDVMEQLYLLQQMSISFKQLGETEKATKIEEILNEYSAKLRAI